MNPNTKVHAALKINGRVIHLGEGMIEIKQVPVHLARAIMDSDLTPQTFSNLDLRLSKRPIKWDNEIGGIDIGLMNHIRQVTDDEPIEGFPDITYGELAALEDDPIWTQYRNLKLNPEQYQGTDSIEVLAAWGAKYSLTKFARLIN